MNITTWFRRLSTIAISILLSLTLFSLPARAFVQTDYSKLLETKACNNCDLSGSDLSNQSLYGSSLNGANLSNANLSGALLNSAKLESANLAGANLSGAKLTASTLSNADLTGANLSHAVLYNALMSKAKLLKVDLTGADLTAAIISDADLSDASAKNAQLNKAILSRSNLSNANFSSSYLRDTKFSKATLQGTNFYDADLFNALMPDGTTYNGDVSRFGAQLSSKPEILDPTFDRTKVNFGITPTGWSNSDDLSIDLAPPIPYQQILSEIALSGFVGTQMSPKYPNYPDQKELLKSELALRNVRISEPWVGTKFTEQGQGDQTLKEFNEQVAFMKDMGGTKLVVAELGGAVHQKPGVDPLTQRPHFTDQQWSDLLTGLNNLGQLAQKNGMQLVYHPHIGTGVENFADIDRLMSGTNSETVKLLLDTGHLYYAGVDPLAVTKKYADRIKHVHLKNIRQSVLDESKTTGRSFLDSIRAGIFTVPGDTNGAINFQPILQELAKNKYEGWLMVEAEQDPKTTNPLKDALTARSYLREVTGL